MPAVDYLVPSNGSTVSAGVDFVIEAGCSDYLAYDPDYTFCNVYLNLGDTTKSYHLTVSEYHEGRVEFVVPMDGRDFPSGYSPSDVVSVGADIYLADGTSSEPWADRVSTYVTYPVSSDPVITQQPELTSPSAGAAGTSVVMTWTAAQMQNQGSAVLHYQVFVGPSSTYSDSYHIATTTGLTHTLTEAEIISKCGNLFGSGTGRGTCYLFVRAYWEIDGTPMAEGWTTPTGQAFIYLPTVNPPQNVSLTPARGKAFTITWTTATMGNGDVATQTHLMRKMDGSESYEAIAQNLSGNSYTFNVPSTWTKNNTYLIALVNIYYIRDALSASVTFTYSPENTIRLGSVDYVIMKYINNTWVAMDPYKYVSGEWKLCSTT